MGGFDKLRLKATTALAFFLEVAISQILPQL